MKLLVLVVPREARDDVEAVLEQAGAAGFTELPGVYGEGSSGPRFGSRIAPGVSDLIFVAIAEEKLAPVREAVRLVESKLDRRLHVFMLPIEEVWG